MKNSIKCSIPLAACLFLIFACGSPAPRENKQSAVNETPSVQQPAVTDIKAKNDSKGIGKFSSFTGKPIDPENVQKGQAVFLSKCVTCHTLNTNALIGPGLKGVTKIRTPEWILNIITNPEEMSRIDPLAKALLKEYKAVMPYQAISEEEAVQIFDFLRQNDID
ncbi:c-type cytochrome [Desertivirga xinjiangensis]|uniref:c-type cytochrome n=1 Tax=Desertivirga xinjiangensis TaxID=539206 RepID=UPI00210D2048|nr:cytochrome c [Pedobacter xinjiangensis]